MGSRRTKRGFVKGLICLRENSFYIVHWEQLKIRKNTNVNKLTTIIKVM